MPRNDPWINDFNGENHLVVAISGSPRIAKGKPCFTFIDKGEGQEPNMFPKTFLSLSEINKRDIPFVQGKFNMGSSGVLGYCGKHWFKLIISRRYDEKSAWGWTLIRRRPVDKDELPVSEYFFPDGKIAEFASTIMTPLTNATNKEFQDVKLTSGSIVKLYDYRTSRFPSVSRLREVFLENLAETVLPFRLLDCRAKADEKRSWPRSFGIDARPFLGMESQVRQKIPVEPEEEPDGDEEDIVSDAQLADFIEFNDPILGTVRIRALMVAPKKMPKVMVRSRNRFFHSVNGQVQFKKQQGLFARMRLSYFQDRMIIIVDASDLFFNAHTQIWKPDREGIRKTDEGDRYLEEVEKRIEESKKLRELHEMLVRKEIQKTQSTGTTDFLQNLVKTDPTLADMLQGNDPTITNVGSGKGDNEGSQNEGDDKGKISPTFLRVLNGKKLYEVQPRGTRIVFETDAEEKYFKRNNDPGSLEIVPAPDAPYNHFSIAHHMTRGHLILYVNPLESLATGAKFKFRVGLKDKAIFPVMNTDKEGNDLPITLEIIEPKKPKKRRKKKKKKDASAGPDLSIPRYRILVKNPDAQYAEQLKGHYTVEKWPEGFSEEDGGMIKGQEENAIYFINYDNRYHLDYRRKQKDLNTRMVITMKFIMGMLLSMIGSEKALRELMKTDDGLFEFEDRFRMLAAKGAASTVLALSEKLSQIIDIKTVKQFEDQDD